MTTGQLQQQEQLAWAAYVYAFNRSPLVDSRTESTWNRYNVARQLRYERLRQISRWARARYRRSTL